MKCVGMNNRILALLAIAAVFSTVAPASVQAEDVQFITNVSYSSHTTGGVSSQGKNGTDGKDGADGKDGTAGASGGSVINIGNNTASVKIGSTANGAEVFEYQNTEIAPEGSSSASLHTASSSTVEAHASLQSSSSSTASEGGVFLALKEKLASLQLMLVTYVSLLF